ncbi:YsnF/AvaK domain-containing protein [Aquisphaera insulae]|uniref:YsnF/AvaK domain-containing protein n=1 Tax=Aquisphaera insulae TaxID=2712864 RepID=UPI0013ECE9AF|nr:YsnF/AvaK domain-containing protein [Aquisphaera insulae]
MAAKGNSTVVGVFEDRRHADQAVADLKKAGFRDDQIGVAMRQTEGTTASGKTGDTYAEEGGVAGLLTGLGLGALAGLGVLSGVIPVVGPAIAAGTLGVMISNAAAGAAVAGLAGALIGYGIPEDEAKYYHEEFEAGRTIVTVTADGRRDEAHAILNRHGAYDMSTRGSVAGRSATAVGTARAATGTARAATGREGDTIQVKEERLHAEKHPVEAGEVRVRKEVRTETKHLEVPVQREEVVIERTPVHGRAATTGVGDDLRAGEEVRIPVREEQVNVSKDAVVTEEVKVGKRVVQDTEHVSGQVRKEEVKVEQTGNVDVRTGGDKTSS